MKRAGICFDFFDCLLQGGGDCVFASGQFLGTCVVKGSSSSVKAASTTKKATSSSKKATATSSASAAAGTGICFDFFDCLLFGVRVFVFTCNRASLVLTTLYFQGGDCVNFKCVKKA